MLQLRAIWSCRKPRSYRRRSISLIFRMDTCSWATKSPPRSVEELPSPAVQRRRPDESFFRKSFRHVNNVSDPVPFLFTSRRNPYSHPRNLYSEFIGTPHSHRPESARASTRRYMESFRACRSSRFSNYSKANSRIFLGSILRVSRRQRRKLQTSKMRCFSLQSSD